MRKYFVPILKLVGLMGLYIITLVIVSGILNFILSSFLGAAVAELLSSLLNLVITLAIILLYLKTDRKHLGDIGVSFERGWHKSLLKGIAEGVVIMAAILVVLLVTDLAALRGLNISSFTAVLTAVLKGIFHYLLIVAVTEELITRGYMYHYLKSRFTIAGAALVTSFIFSAMHIFNPGITVLALFNIFLAGVVINLLVMRDNNIWSAIGFHFAWNFTMGVVFSSPVSGGGREGIIKYSLKGYELLTGGRFGIEGGLVCTVALLLLGGYIVYKKPFTDLFVAGLKRPRNAWFASILIVIMMFSVIADTVTWMSADIKSDSLEVNEIGKYPNANEYMLKLELDPTEKTLAGTQHVSYINNSKDSLNEVYFHIYPNAFASLDGGITIDSILVNNKPVSFHIEGEDRTLLYIPLEVQLKPQDRCKIDMNYRISIPHKGNNGFGDRFGYGDNTFNLGNFFPIAAVYEKEWDRHIYDQKGDAFYSETSNFEVQITAPKGQVIAATGVVESTVETAAAQGKRVWNISAPAVRDFAFVSSDMFEVEEVIINGTTIKSYASSKIKAKKVLGMAAEAIHVLNNKIGKYPYPTISIVQSDIGGGMEYPNLVMIESAAYDNIGISNVIYSYIFSDMLGSLEHVVVHELAHQWWYGLVGNDEYREAWIDEPLTEYSTLLYYKEKYGEKGFNRIYEYYIKFPMVSMAASISSNPSLNRDLNEFEEAEYYILIYNKGSMMFKDLHDKLGDEAFNLFLRTMFDRYQFRIVKGNDVIKLASEAAGKDMQEFFQKWLETSYMGDQL